MPELYTSGCVLRKSATYFFAASRLNCRSSCKTVSTRRYRPLKPGRHPKIAANPCSRISTTLKRLRFASRIHSRYGLLRLKYFSVAIRSGRSSTSFHDHLSSCIHAGNRTSGLLTLTIAPWVTGANKCRFGPQFDALSPAGGALPPAHQCSVLHSSRGIPMNQLMHFL